MQIVTSTCNFCASASAAATIVLMAARFRYFLVGSSAAAMPTSTQSTTASSLSMVRDATTCTCGFPRERACKKTLARLENTNSVSVERDRPRAPFTGQQIRARAGNVYSLRGVGMVQQEDPLLVI